MTWTILILVIAAALYLLGGKLLHKDGKKEITPAAIYAKKALNALAVVLAIVGVNRLGFGTSYYLTESNPSILQTMAQNMQQQRSGSSNKEIKGHIKKNSAEMIKYAPVLGNENADAKKTIFVFTDATCPYCVRLHGELKRVLADRSDVRIVVKNFSIHGVLSDGAAKASIAAKLQGNDKAAALYQLLMDKPYWPEDMSKVKQEDLPKIINKNMLKAKDIGLPGILF